MHFAARFMGSKRALPKWSTKNFGWMLEGNFLANRNAQNCNEISREWFNPVYFMWVTHSFVNHVIHLSDSHMEVFLG